ncbi:MAG TPA: phosphoribosyltransferase family protein [Acidimicrobiia bacterium]|nr:phosphoribosyltransferase family protein [Acidimicrobiia bacterium]
MDRGEGFADRVDAGRRLGAALRARVAGSPVVAGIPRGGVVVAAEVAAALQAPLRAVVARKVGAPGRPELALGAVGPDGTVVLDETLARRAGATTGFLDRAVATVRREVEARTARLAAVVTADEARDRGVVVVDDGVATGSTAAAVGRWLATVGARVRVLALPVGPADTLAALREEYEDVLALETPAYFVAVGQWYRDFRQVTDDEVARLLGAGPAGTPTT